MHLMEIPLQAEAYRRCDDLAVTTAQGEGAQGIS